MPAPLKHEAVPLIFLPAPWDTEGQYTSSRTHLSWSKIGPPLEPCTHTIYPAHTWVLARTCKCPSIEFHTYLPPSPFPINISTQGNCVGIAAQTSPHLQPPNTSFSLQDLFMAPISDAQAMTVTRKCPTTALADLWGPSNWPAIAGNIEHFTVSKHSWGNHDEAGAGCARSCFAPASE
jgi:hypothetical protein